MQFRHELISMHFGDDGGKGDLEDRFVSVDNAVYLELIRGLYGFMDELRGI